MASNTLALHRRFALEIGALQEAGARLTAVTWFPDPTPLPDNIAVHASPLLQRSRPRLEELIPESSSAAWRPRMLVENLLLNAIRRVVSVRAVRAAIDRVLRPELLDTTERRRLLDSLAPDTDLFWVIDFENLESTITVARRHRIPVLYETIDLIPEYQWDWLGPGFSERALRTEARLMRHIDGFITACDSYADYYEERYAGIRGFRRPVVHDNAPDGAVSAIRPTGTPRRFLFLGALSFDRPVLELIEACSLTETAVSLTLQGENLLGDAPQELIDKLKLGNRVRLLEPCAPEATVRVAAEYDVGIIALRGTNENERRAASSKAFTYMAAGLAILGSDLPGIARVVRTHENGRLVAEMTPEAWAAAFDEMERMPGDELDALKQRSLDAFDEYSWERQKPLFVAEFLRALGRR